MAQAWPAISQLVGYIVATAFLLSLVAFTLCEYMGARIPGFSTISDAARLGAAQGDFRIFVAIEIGLLVAAIWWPCHILFPKL